MSGNGSSSSKSGANRILIACIGNIFLGDDGFGVEVGQRLLRRQDRRYPADVQVEDFGIRGMDLAYALLEEYDALVLVDAVPRGGQPGTLYLIEPKLPLITQEKGEGTASVGPDAHSMDPVKVLAFAQTLGARSIRTLLVGCEPGSPNIADPHVEMQMGLSEPVEAAVDDAIKMIDRLVEELITSKEAT
jgi:hydrogenase maturation protease